MNDLMWAAACLVGPVVLLTLALMTLVGFARTVELLQQRMAARRTGTGGSAPRGGAASPDDLDEKIATAARGLAEFGPEVQWAAGRLSALISRHPRPGQAVAIATASVRRSRAAAHGRDRATAADAVADAGVGATGPERAGLPQSPSPQPSSYASGARCPARETTSSAVSSDIGDVVARWLDLDNITLLLYVGATLIVIAAGIFVGSSWDAIGPMSRFGVVAFTAVAFFVVGEAFVQHSAQLARAGETFRGVGMVLLPFVGLAYDEFVLSGGAQKPYWLTLAVVLALVYYALYQWVSPGRLTVYLAAISAAVAALLLPDVFGLDGAWQASALLLASAGLMGVAWAAEPSREDLFNRARGFGLRAITESHLIVGAIVALLSVMWLVVDMDFIRPDLATVVYFCLLTAMLVGAGWWSRSNWIMGLGALAAGVTIHQAGHYALPDPTMLAGTLCLSWAAFSWLLYMLARWLDDPDETPAPVMTAVAVLWGVASAAYAVAPVLDSTRVEVDGLLAVAATSLAGLFVALARRHRTGELLWPAAVLLHVVVLDLLLLLPGDNDLPVAVTVIWLVLAGGWLYLMRRGTPSWAPNAVSLLFVAEAVWAALYAVLDETYLSAAVAGLVLTALWAIWARMRSEPLGLVAICAQAVYALFAVWVLIGVPALFMPFVVLALGVTALSAIRLLTGRAMLVTEVCSLVLLAMAPVTGYAVGVLGAPDSGLGFLSFGQAAQISLLLSMLLVAARGYETGNRGFLGVAVVQAFVLYAWVASSAGVSEVQAYTVPLGVMFLALAWLFDELREPLECLAAVIILLPAGAEAAFNDSLGHTLLLGLLGLGLLAAGMSFGRRVLVATGIAGILLAAIRQLWEIVAALPPGFVVGAVGLLLMALAVMLMLRRDVVLDLGRKGGRYWDEMG